MRPIFALLLLLLLGTASLHAQTSTPAASPAATATASPTPTPANATRFWRATLPGGTYLVALAAIQAISLHEYLIPPVTRVTEMTVETSSSVETRFYYLETETPQSPVSVGQSAIELLKEKTDEVAQAVAGSDDAWKKVVKTYPATTHAHTVEYRLESLDDLKKLFNDADHAWTTNQGDEIKIE